MTSTRNATPPATPAASRSPSIAGVPDASAVDVSMSSLKSSFYCSPRPDGSATPSMASAGAHGGSNGQPWQMSVGYVLLLRMLEMTEGLSYLKNCGWLRRELIAWQQVRL